jgi:very-short-patch-repair endonuclease
LEIKLAMKSKINQARNLRVCQTSAENILWRRLRGRRFGGFKFRRQHDIDAFIVDFYCAELNLIIEIDGDVHGYDAKARRDQERESALRDMGYDIVRYSNRDVYDNLDGVLEDLRIRCEDLGKNKADSPHPDPLP